MNRLFHVFIIFIFCSYSLSSQTKLRFLNSDKSHFKIPFEVSQNLIIVPLSINGSDIMKFILDSGISSTIVTEMTGVDTIFLNLAREVQLEGLGDGEPVIALYSQNNTLLIEDPLFKGHGVVGDSLDVFVIPEDRFEFSKQFGLQINGLIGSDFFINFIVEIDYLNKQLSFHKREDFNYKKKTKRHFALPLIIENKKPYAEIKMIQENGVDLDVKLLIDTGASMALWLSVFSDKRIKKPEITFPALLGQGLNGNIEGVNGRIAGIEIGPYKIKRPIAAFPDSSGILGITREEGRNGTIGNEILKRFHVYFDYEGKKCYLRANKNLRDPFNYNRSGLEIEKPFYNVPVYKIYDVVPGSPADEAGLKIGDQIEMINLFKAVNIELDQINSILYGMEGRVVRLRVKRDGEEIRVKFTLNESL